MKQYNYIGLACTGHDNALAIINSKGELVFAENIERFLQNKRAMDSAPDDMFRISKLISTYCEKDCDIIMANSWSDKALTVIDKIKDSISKQLSDQNLHQEWKDRLKAQEYIAGLVANNIVRSGRNVKYFAESDGRKVIKQSYDHHLCHAAAGAYTSPFKESIILVVDGAGEGKTITIYSYKNGVIEEVKTENQNITDMTGSLGWFYGYLCRLCGYSGWKGEEWKVMGLAPYGKFDQKIYDLFKKYIKIDNLRIIHPATSKETYIELLKFARKPNSHALTVADLAYTGQHYFSEMMNELISNIHKLGISDNIIISGGCALNSAYNGFVTTQTPFKNLHIYSAPGDDGNAVGAAFLAYYSQNNPATHSPKLSSPYLGSVMEQETLDNIKKFSKIPGLQELSKEQIYKKTATLLAEGKIIGWVQGKAEFGPRSLGNRSILASPCFKDMKDKINSSVKFREEYRPFAPSILPEYADDYFEDFQDSPYMERTLKFKESVQDKIPAVVHEDKTGRLQTVKKEWNEDFYNLISEFHKLTGVPVLLNTSFNVMGKPIIHSAEDAIAVFYTSGLDALIINNYLITK